MTFAVVVLILGGMVVIGIAWAGRVGRLPRNRWAGIRLPSTLRSDPAWAAAHRATWVETALAGAVMIAWGIWLWFDATAVRVGTWIMVGTSTVLLVIGAIRAHRIARAVPDHTPPTT